MQNNGQRLKEKRKMTIQCKCGKYTTIADEADFIDQTEYCDYCSLPIAETQNELYINEDTVSDWRLVNGANLIK